MVRPNCTILTCAVTEIDPHFFDVATSSGDCGANCCQAIAAAEAGATIVHLHARNPVDDSPDQRSESFLSFLSVIKQRSNCVINLTTGGAATMPIDERLRPAAAFIPEVASLNMGLMNFGLYPMLERFKKFAQAWERPYLEGSRGHIFRNTFANIEKILTSCNEAGTRFEVECNDIGHPILWRTSPIEE
ncbi:uncharacterized protein (DUF849 family) [Bradyrhizobium sp. GM2.4]